MINTLVHDSNNRFLIILELNQHIKNFYLLIELSLRHIYHYPSQIHLNLQLIYDKHLWKIYSIFIAFNYHRKFCLHVWWQISNPSQYIYHNWNFSVLLSLLPIYVWNIDMWNKKRQESFILHSHPFIFMWNSLRNKEVRFSGKIE